MKKPIALIVAVILASIVYRQHAAAPASRVAPTRVEASTTQGQITGTGTVLKILPDDNDGERHQRFILRLASGKTLLVAHNIDLAPRVFPLSEGDTVEYKGQYASNGKGGVVHWTHHDPTGRHPGGWLKHDGQTFQ